MLALHDVLTAGISILASKGAQIATSPSGLIRPCLCAGSRQASKLRQRYLQAVLRQEPAYFDVHATTGDLLQGLNDDTSAIQLAIGEKACGALLQ